MKTGLLGSGNLAFVERLYAKFVCDPASVPAEWRDYFEEWMRTEGDGQREWSPGPHFGWRSVFHPATERAVAVAPAAAAEAYCREFGVEYRHIGDGAVRRWLRERLARIPERLELSRELQRRILTRLTEASVFEEFIRKKYVGAKTFSLEGAESLIPLLDLALERARQDGVRAVVIGMAHRGRLNVLANIIGKSPSEIFREFEDATPELYDCGGDVKYHLGFEAQRDGLRLALCFNPSHVEHINPVTLGRARALRDRGGGALAILLHGDAAFCGEGIVQETLNLSRLPAYDVGGVLHVIVDNGLGFTTPAEQARSMRFASGPARMLDSPILHVDGENPEAVVKCVELALDCRQELARDVFVHLYCYRRWGHNESDEPTFTQPVRYRAIAQRPSVREVYLGHLLKLGGVTRAEADDLARARHEQLDAQFNEAKSRPQPQRWSLPERWRGYSGGPEPDDDEPATAVERSRLAELLEAQTRLPEGFHLHPKLRRALQARQAMVRGERPLDWAAAESLALATLATQGVRVRLTGQDTERGTFSQRHAVLHDYEDGHTYVPLQNLTGNQAPVEIANSPLSELGALGFEYGYSLDAPDALVCWEAQYGDFVNAAEVVIDQFLVSAETKWCQLSGLVLLLPHGAEGHGPEHSSARLERFLALAVADNIQVVQPTTPAQYFHCLRRQALRRWRKPLVLLTPKSLLRHASAVSSLDELATGSFQRVLPGEAVQNPRRVVLCSGKIYYELSEHRPADVALLRVEQLYPLPALDCSAPTFWVQEEPANMGAWPMLRSRYGQQLKGITRPESSSPATGSTNAHRQQQEKLIREAYGD